MAGQDERDGPLEYAFQAGVAKRFVYRLYQGVQFDGGRSPPNSGILNVATPPDSDQQTSDDITNGMRNQFRRIVDDLRQRHEYHTVLDNLNELVNELVNEEIQRERYLDFVYQCLPHDSDNKVSFQEVADESNDTIQSVQSILNPDYPLPDIHPLHVDRDNEIVALK